MNKKIDNSKYDRIIASLTIGYMVLVCIYMLAHRAWFSPDQFFVFALFGSLILGRGKLFILDWSPFLCLFLGYEYLRSLVPLISKNVHIFPMIDADKFIFGYVPTIKFQGLFYNPNKLNWYDYFLVILYISHFVMPLVIGFIFWIKDRHFFKKYAFGLLALSYVSFITYILYPAMPPWMAADHGYLPPVEEVTGNVMSHFLPRQFSVPTVYSIFRANPVAAMPSLHAAFPLLIFFFVFKKSKRFALVFIPYVLGVWFAVMYLGEHYFADVLAGAIYASVIFFVLEKRRFLLSKIKMAFSI